MYQWLWSKFYDKVMKEAEEKGLKDWRRILLENISGDVLELGCGTGANLAFYPAKLNRLVLTEPNINMRQKLKAKIQIYNLNNAKILNDRAESLSLSDSSFDVVICTLVLCSVNNLENALSEIHRILRPAGKFIFIEHVSAENNSSRYRWQRRLEFLWKHITDGCHTTRCTENTIINSGFKIVNITRQSMRGVPAIVRPSIRGVAVKS